MLLYRTKEMNKKQKKALQVKSTLERSTHVGYYGEGAATLTINVLSKLWNGKHDLSVL